MNKYMLVGFGVLVGLLAAGLLWITVSPPRGEPVTLLPTPTPELITIHVAGAVAAPGIYILPQDSRMVAAIEAAGGFLPTADSDQLNLASRLFDGQQVIVPAIGGENHTIGGRININSATLEELDSLPGIGPTTAQNILDYRRQFGAFRSIEELLEVTGIGQTTYDTIRDLVTVGP